MRDYSIDYNELSNTVNKVEKNIYRLSDVKHLLDKVAFDVVKFKDSDELWQVQDSDDGSYIIARYELDEPEAKKVSATHWDTLVSESSGDINIFYKGQPIVKMAASKLGISSEDVKTIKRFLPGKLASDKSFVKAMLNTLDESSRDAILKLYPELL